MSHALHPYRLFLSETEWNTLPEKLHDPYFQRIAETNHRALELLDTQAGETILDLPTRLADESVPRRVTWRAIKTRLLRATVAFYLERRDTHIDFALRTLDFFLEHEPGAVHYGDCWLDHADLKTADEWYDAAFALDALGPFLGDERADATIAFLRNGLNSYLKGIQAGEWWHHADFNWCAALHGNAGLAALALEPYHPELAQHVLREARDGIHYVIDAFPPGGGWIEGLMYQTTTIAHLTDFAHALFRTTGDDLELSHNRNFIDSLAYRMYMLGDDQRIFNFSNCFDFGNQWSLPHAFWWAQRCERPDLTWFENQHPIPWTNTTGVFCDVEAFWYRPAFPDSVQPELQPLKHFQGLDWVTWHGEHTWLAFRSGFNGGNHCNRDLGHFIFGAGPDRFLLDPGYGAGHPNQHNCVTIRGRDQADCARATIFRLRARPAGFYLACDLTAVSPHTLAFYYRHLLLIDETHLLVVDHMLSRAGRRLGARYHLQTRLPVECDNGNLHIKGSQHTLTLQHLAPTCALDVTPWEYRGQDLSTISWRDSHDRVHALHPYLLSLAPAEASWGLDGDIFTLELDGAHHRIDLAEGSLLVEH